MTTANTAVFLSMHQADWFLEDRYIRFGNGIATTRICQEKLEFN